MRLKYRKSRNGRGAAKLQHHEEPGQGQAEYVHGYVIRQGIGRGEGLGPVVQVGTGQDEGSQYGYQDRRRQVVNLNPGPLTAGLGPLVALVLEDGQGEPDGNYAHHQG